jgi:hypothetical protein
MLKSVKLTLISSFRDSLPVQVCWPSGSLKVLTLLVTCFLPWSSWVWHCLLPANLQATHGPWGRCSFPNFFIVPSESLSYIIQPLAPSLSPQNFLFHQVTFLWQVRGRGWTIPSMERDAGLLQLVRSVSHITRTSHDMVSRFPLGHLFMTSVSSLGNPKSNWRRKKIVPCLSQ